VALPTAWASWSEEVRNPQSFVKQQLKEQAVKQIKIATADKPKDLATKYAEVKNKAKEFGFDAVTELKKDVVEKAMTDKKKKADFLVELDVVGKKGIVQLVCDVQGVMRSVIGRKQIETAEEYKKYHGLAKLQSLKDFEKEIGV
jgi:hypothetical protein